MSGNISKTKCIQTARCNDEINEKLDRIISMLERMNGIRGFGSDIFANVLGNIITR